MKKLYILSIVLCGLFLTAAAAAGEVVLIVKIFERQTGPNVGIVIDKLTLSKGWPPMVRRKKNSQLAPHEIQVLNSKGSVIYAQGFDFIRHLEVPLPESGSEEQGGPSRVAIKEPEAVIVIPYLSEGKSIRVKGPYGATPLTATPALSASYRASSSKPSPAPAMEGKLYILIMASGYSEMSGFQAKAQETKDYLLSKEPFASRVEDVSISIYENTADLGCYTGCFDIDRLMCCDSEKVIAAAVASGMLYDEIIIIHNTTTYSGGGYRDHGTYEDNSANSFCQVYSGSDTAPMTLHEFGHSFGNLCDEYTYGSEGYTYYDCANCRASCSDWIDVSSGCQLGCDAKSDYYRPEDSIMISYENPYYNQPSIHNSLIPRLNYFAPPGIVPKGSIPVSIFQLLLDE